MVQRTATLWHAAVPSGHSCCVPVGTCCTARCNAPVHARGVQLVILIIVFSVCGINFKKCTGGDSPTPVPTLTPTLPPTPLPPLSRF
jgi:hypothetical protein